MKLRFISVLIIILSLTSACAGNQQAEDGNGNKNQDHVVNVRNSTTNSVDKKTGREVSKHLVELASEVPDVNDATAVVLGNYAVVGIDVNSKLDRSRVESIKYTVAESLKKDPYGANAVVIADPDTMERLREMGNQIQEGHPVGGILDELAAIVGRVVPEIPSEIIQTEYKNPTEENDQQLNNKEEEKLDKQQDKQSKNNMNKDK